MSEVLMHFLETGSDGAVVTRCSSLPPPGNGDREARQFNVVTAPHV